MACPYYEGERKCGFKSKSYELSQETIENHCNLNYQTCEIFDEKMGKKLDDVVKRIKELERTGQKVTPEMLQSRVDL